MLEAGIGMYYGRCIGLVTAGISLETGRMLA